MRVIGRLTSNKIRNAKPKPNGRTFLCDGGGLWLQVSTGKEGQVCKSWYYRYASPQHQRERVMGLGSLHTVGLAEARAMACQARLMVLRGQDPVDVKHASRASLRAARAKRPTFIEVADEYLQKYESGWKSDMHRLQWRNTLQTYILPILGRMDVEAVDTDAVLQVLEPIWTTIPETASRVRGRIEAVLDFAGRNRANPARWKGHLQHKLAKRNKARTVEHLAALPYTEMAAFMAELRAVNSIPARALELTVLCATRTGETIGARWDEFDLAKRLWTIPASRTKRDKQHAVPLSDAAVAVLEFMEAIRQNDLVFPVNDSAMLICLRDLRPGITVHGFRSTFRSWAGGCTTTPRDVCETALGHSTGNAAEQAYMRDTLLAKRRVLMADWAEFCKTADIVRLDVRKAIPA